MADLGALEGGRPGIRFNGRQDKSADRRRAQVIGWVGFFDTSAIRACWRSCRKGQRFQRDQHRRPRACAPAQECAACRCSSDRRRSSRVWCPDQVMAIVVATLGERRGVGVVRLAIEHPGVRAVPGDTFALEVGDMLRQRCRAELRSPMADEPRHEDDDATSGRVERDRAARRPPPT